MRRYFIHKVTDSKILYASMFLCLYTVAMRVNNLLAVYLFVCMSDILSFIHTASIIINVKVLIALFYLQAHRKPLCRCKECSLKILCILVSSIKCILHIIFNTTLFVFEPVNVKSGVSFMFFK